MQKFLAGDTCKLEARNLRSRCSDLGPQDPGAGSWPRGRKQEGKGVDRTVLPALAFPSGRMWSLSLECGWPLLQGTGSEWPPPSKPPLWLGLLALRGTGVSSLAPFLSNPVWEEAPPPRAPEKNTGKGSSLAIFKHVHIHEFSQWTFIPSLDVCPGAGCTIRRWGVGGIWEVAIWSFSHARAGPHLI